MCVCKYMQYFIILTNFLNSEINVLFCCKDHFSLFVLVIFIFIFLHLSFLLSFPSLSFWFIYPVKTLLYRRRESSA
uniref:Uncharacterized protein n=1 Tax=Anguilla anguilla TaxID=7936 RepID=A0A0E9R8N2_ANGAN